SDWLRGRVPDLAGGDPVLHDPPPREGRLRARLVRRMSDTERWMEEALALAKSAAVLGEVPIGCVIVHQPTGCVVGRGYNRRQIDRDPTAHAEILALREAGRALGHWRLLDCTMVVTLEPCPMCAGAVVNARLPRLVYGFADP